VVPAAAAVEPGCATVSLAPPPAQAVRPIVALAAMTARRI
jgi:hypothetical protein